MNYIIKDWAGNHCFKDKEFLSFEDAWEFLFSKFDDSELEEYEVVEKGVDIGF
jgi:hypothetical protein